MTFGTHLVCGECGEKSLLEGYMWRVWREEFIGGLYVESVTRRVYWRVICGECDEKSLLTDIITLKIVVSFCKLGNPVFYSLVPAPCIFYCFVL